MLVKGRGETADMPASRLRTASIFGKDSPSLRGREKSFLAGKGLLPLLVCPLSLFWIRRVEITECPTGSEFHPVLILTIDERSAILL
jgi:hypothetical protein